MGKKQSDEGCIKKLMEGGVCRRLGAQRNDDVLAIPLKEGSD